MQWGALVTIGLLGTIGQILRTRSFILLKGAVASAISLTIVFFTLMFTGLFDHQWPKPMELTLYALTIFGVLLMQRANLEKIRLQG